MLKLSPAPPLPPLAQIIPEGERFFFTNSSRAKLEKNELEEDFGSPLQLLAINKRVGIAMHNPIRCMEILSKLIVINRRTSAAARHPRQRAAQLSIRGTLVSPLQGFVTGAVISNETMLRYHECAIGTRQYPFHLSCQSILDPRS